MGEIKLKDDKIELLESEVAILTNAVNVLERKCDDNEQYSRRMSLRISDIPTSDISETKDKCINLVLETLNGINGVNITQSDIDRCHRVGKKTQPILNK